VAAGTYANHLNLQTDNHANIPSLNFFKGRMVFLPPNQQCQRITRRFTNLNNQFWIRWNLSCDVAACLPRITLFTAKSPFDLFLPTECEACFTVNLTCKRDPNCDSSRITVELLWANVVIGAARWLHLTGNI